MSDRNAAMKKHPAPWSVYRGKLRPSFPKPIIEIIDRNGDVVLPWPAFDATGQTVPMQRKLAKQIVDAVNFYAWLGEQQ